jgi:hypothetical protein
MLVSTGSAALAKAKEPAVTYRLVVALCAVALLCATLVPTASAARDWCSTDPAVPLTTPAGNRLVVFLTLGAPGERYLDELARHQLTTTATPTFLTDGSAGTRFTLTVLVPDDAKQGQFPTTNIVSSEANAGGTIHARADSTSGQTVRLQVTVAVP